MHESNHRHRQQTAKKRSRLDSGLPRRIEKKPGEPRLPVFLCAAFFFRKKKVDAGVQGTA